MSLSKFYYLCPKNYKKGSKKTDMCPICTKRESLKKLNLESLTTEKRNSIKEQKEIRLQHQVAVAKQKEAFERDLKEFNRSSTRITMDFKQNIKLGGGLVETSNMYYRKNISVLEFI